MFTSMSQPPLDISVADPLSPDASVLIQALSRELAARYDFVDDGSGDFRAEDAAGRGSGFVIGRMNDQPVACGAFRPLAEGVAEIKRMFVVPECRGRGYSRLILAELERRCVDAGYTTARLETADRQPEAIALYERSGYRRIPPFGDYVDSERSVCFEKSLT